MRFNFLDNLALYVVNERSSLALQNIAMQGLEENYESPSLIVLAGLPANENPFIVDEYFKKTLQELKLDLSQKNKAAVFLIKSVAEKIINESLDVYEGCDFLFSKILSFTDLREYDDKYVYDSIGLAEVYSLYTTIDELMNASMKWDKIKSNEQLIEEAEDNIKIKLSEWHKNRFPLL